MDLLPTYQNIARAQARAQHIRESGHGIAIPLIDRYGPFWSRGWRGCVCNKRVDDWTVELRPFLDRRGQTVTRGWRCT